MNINELNQDCILRILSKLSPNESIPVRQVCPYWKYLIEYYHFRPLKSLKLFGSVSDVEKYCQLVIKYDFDDYYFESPNPRNHLVLRSIANYSISSTLLTKLFPSVSCLVYFNFSDSLTVIDLNHLLERWSATIEALFLYHLSSRLRPILLPTLKQLYNFDSLDKNSDEFVLSVLPQLEHILLTIEYDGERLKTFLDGKMLNFLGLKQLKLNVHEVEYFVNYVLNRMDRKVLQNITHFQLDHCMPERGLSIEE